MFPKRGAVALGLTAIALVLLLSFRTPEGAAIAVANGPSTSGTGITGQANAAHQGTRTIDGTAVQTRYGTVQVRVTLQGDTITAIQAVQLPDGDGRSMQISSRVEPTLQRQALQAQSANIDGVSGATYTSIGYARSLQSALDSAGI
jgi:uncharacterized protein with FMN-binding domain